MTTSLRLVLLVVSLFWMTTACGQRRAPLSLKRMQPYQTEKFRLRAGPAGAKGYPMTIQIGNFIRSDGKTFPVPSGHTLESGWDGSAIAWAVGDEMQPAPDSLEILYFSYLEDTFYEGFFALPQQDIHTLLKQGFWDKKSDQLRTYDELTVSVLPAGRVVVWLVGAGRQVLVGRYQAAASPQTDFRRFYKTVDRAEMLGNKRAAAPAEAQQQLTTEGKLTSAKWDAYFTTYPWQVAANVPLTLYRTYSVKYLNGELRSYPLTDPRPRGGLDTYNQELLTPMPKPVPQRLSLYFQAEHGAKYLARVQAFDEAELLAAFEQLHREHPKGPITLYYAFDKPYQKATLSLKNEWRAIPLLKSKVEVLSED